jgi:hypothetical protein
MKSLAEFLSEKREVTIHTLASYIRPYMREQWQPLLQEHQEELLRMFDQAGEYAYGMFFRMLCQPIQEQLRLAGFVCQPDYPGDFRTASVEYWGPPEERERCLYCSILKSDRTNGETFGQPSTLHDVSHPTTSIPIKSSGNALGTLVLQVFHDHTQFRVPSSPGIFALEETESEAIIEALSHASVRLRGRQQQGEAPQHKWAIRHSQPRWEYSVEVGLADCIDERRIEISESMLDSTLAVWGHNGWELVTVVPHGERMIAFFKRPAEED